MAGLPPWLAPKTAKDPNGLDAQDIAARASAKKKKKKKHPSSQHMKAAVAKRMAKNGKGN